MKNSIDDLKRNIQNAIATNTTLHVTTSDGGARYGHGGFDVAAEAVIEIIRSELLALILESMDGLKKERPEAGPNRNGNSEGVRKAYNKGVSEVEQRLKQLFGSEK